MNGPNAGLYALNVTVADGWRARYYVGNQFYAFSFDPEGNAVSRQNSADTLYNAYATSTFEAYGSRGGDFSTASGSHPASHQDPVRFGGQYGYYSDFGTGLYLLTHRYYDAGAGRFLNRDPIGYKGGINLYGFAGNNPINESDPSGYNPLSRFLGREASALGRTLHKGGQLVMDFLEEGAVDQAKYGNLSPAIPEPPIIAGSPDSRAAQEENAEVGRTQKLPKGGTYILRDPVNGKVMRTGMATSFVKRKSDHKKEYPGLVFEVDKRSSSKDARRGREQIIHDLHKPPYNKQNPIKEKNYTPEEYKRMMDAGRKL